MPDQNKTVNGSETNPLPDGAPAELSSLKERKLYPTGHCVSSPSTLMPDDPISTKDCPVTPQREGEYPIEVPKRMTPDMLGEPLKKGGLSSQWWDETKRELCEKYGELMALDLRIPRILVTQEIFSYDFLERAQRQCVEMAENDALSAEDRLAAVDSLGYLADIATKKAKQLLELGEKANRKTSEKKPRNLPPNALVQVNVSGGPAQPRTVSPVTELKAEEETSH